MPAPTLAAVPAPTLAAWLRAAAARLADAGLDAPVREARLLLRLGLGLSEVDLLRDARGPVPPGDLPRLDALLERRAAREPLALLRGEQGFWTLDLAVSAETLVPRADSEALVEAALLVLPDPGGAARVLDLGTGTGCLLLAVLAERPGAWGVGVDLNPAAAALARDNARRLGLHGRCATLAGSWADALRGRFDLVLCNPPYIPSAVLPTLMPEVRLHEPARALDGGADGLDAYRAVLAALPGLLAPGGAAVLELGIGQAPAVTALAASRGLRVRGLRADLGGVDRALVLEEGSKEALLF